jgi:hypothetical protein
MHGFSPFSPGRRGMGEEVNYNKRIIDEYYEEICLHNSYCIISILFGIPEIPVDELQTNGYHI